MSGYSFTAFAKAIENTCRFQLQISYHIVFLSTLVSVFDVEFIISLTKLSRTAYTDIKADLYGADAPIGLTAQNS